jgi:hypothetical protein
MTHTVKPVFRGTKKNWPYKTDYLLKEVVRMKFSMTGQEKGDLLIQVTA